MMCNRPRKGEPEYGTLLWVMCTVMQLCADRVQRHSGPQKDVPAGSHVADIWQLCQDSFCAATGRESAGGH